MSSDARSAVRNSAASIAGQMVNLLVGLVSSVYVARLLGREQFGMLSWGLGLTEMLRAAANVGIDNVLIRDLARDRSKAGQYLMSTFVVKLIASLVCYAGIAVYLHFRHYQGLQLAVGYILCGMVVAEAMSVTCRSALAGLERQDLSASVLVISNVARVATTILLVYMGYNIVAVAWVVIATALLALVAQIYILRRNLPAGVWRPDFGIMKYLVVTGSTFLASQFFAGIFDRAGYVLLDIYKNVSAVGTFSAAYRIVEIVTMIACNCSLALFPIMSRRVHGSKEEYARALHRSTKYLTMLGIPLCAGIYLLSHTLMVGLYSEKFAASGACLAVLIWSRLITFAVLPGQQAVQARNAQLWLVPPVVIRVAISLGLMVYAIPRYGAFGASVAVLIAENFYYSSMYLIAFRGPERFNPIVLLGRPILAGVAMMVVAHSLRPLGPVVATGGGLTTYVLGLFALGAVDSEDKRILRSLLSDTRKSAVIPSDQFPP